MSNLVQNVFFDVHSKIVELEEELRVVGNNLKSLEVSEEKVCQLVSHSAGGPLPGPLNNFISQKLDFKFANCSYILLKLKQKTRHRLDIARVLQ